LILVLCGTQKQDFSRMIKEVEKLADEHDIVVQAGHTEYVSDKMEVFGFVAPEKLTTLYDKAQYVVSHGGAGSMFQGIQAGKKMLVFPRLQKYGEHVDDHQLQLAGKLNDLGYLLTFKDNDDIVDVFGRLKAFTPKPYDLKGNFLTLIDDKLEKSLGS